MTRVVIALLLAHSLATAGCGADDEPERKAARTETQPRTEDQTPDPDEAEIRKLANDYYRAYEKRDWKGVCDTLSPRAQARLARKAQSSCEQAYREASKPAAVRGARDLVPGLIRVSGDRATVQMTLRGSSDTIVKLYAAKLDGRWWVYIKRAAQGAP